MWPACVCPRFKTKTTRAIGTKLGMHIDHGRTLACGDPEFKSLVSGMGMQLTGLFKCYYGKFYGWTAHVNDHAKKL